MRIQKYVKTILGIFILFMLLACKKDENLNVEVVEVIEGNKITEEYKMTVLTPGSHSDLEKANIEDYHIEDSLEGLSLVSNNDKGYLYYIDANTNTGTALEIEGSNGKGLRFLGEKSNILDENNFYVLVNFVGVGGKYTLNYDNNINKISLPEGIILKDLDEFTLLSKKAFALNYWDKMWFTDKNKIYFNDYGNYHVGKPKGTGLVEIVGVDLDTFRITSGTSKKSEDKNNIYSGYSLYKTKKG